MSKIAACIRSRAAARIAVLLALCASTSSCTWLRGEFVTANRLPASCASPEGADVPAGAISRP